MQVERDVEVMERDGSSLIAHAREAALKAGRLASEAFRRGFAGDGAVDQKKSYADIVTATDRESEQVIARHLLAAVPDSVVVGEEFGERGSGPTRWVVDPIDGTSNFASGLPIYVVSIGVFHAGQPVGGVVYDPERDEMFSCDAEGFTVNGKRFELDPGRRFRDSTCELLSNVPYEQPGRVDPQALGRWAEWVGSFRAVRRLGCCALQFAYVAAGRAAVCYEAGAFRVWDIAAGLQFVQAAGGRILAWDEADRPIRDLAEMDRIRSVLAAAPGFELADTSLRNVLPPALLQGL